jgi:hypothetical protein
LHSIGHRQQRKRDNSKYAFSEHGEIPPWLRIDCGTQSTVQNRATAVFKTGQYRAFVGVCSPIRGPSLRTTKDPNEESFTKILA